MTNDPGDAHGSSATTGWVVVKADTREAIATFANEQEAKDEAANRGHGHAVKRFSHEKDDPIKIDWES